MPDRLPWLQCSCSYRCPTGYRGYNVLVLTDARPVTVVTMFLFLQMPDWLPWLQCSCSCRCPTGYRGYECSCSYRCPTGYRGDYCENVPESVTGLDVVQRAIIISCSLAALLVLLFILLFFLLRRRVRQRVSTSSSR